MLGLRRFALVLVTVAGMVLSAFVMVAVNANRAGAAAQSCTTGTAIGNTCYLPSTLSLFCGSPYLPFGTQCAYEPPGSPFACPPAEEPVIPDPANNRCVHSGKLVCPPSVTLVNGQCIVPIGCVDGSALFNGKCGGGGGGPGTITLNYTVECRGEGIAKIVYAQAILTDAAHVSLTTFNGSPALGAEFPGGTAINIQITPSDPATVVTINGPAVAQACLSAAPTATTVAPTPTPTSPPPAPTRPASTGPTATPVPPRPTATLVPPSSTPTPIATESPTPQVTVTPESDSESPSAATTVSLVSMGPCGASGNASAEFTASLTPAAPNDSLRWVIDGVPLGGAVAPGPFSLLVRGDGQPHEVGVQVISPAGSPGASVSLDYPACDSAGASSECEPGQALLNDRCVPPCAEAEVPTGAEADSCYQLTGTTDGSTAQVADDDGFPIVPVAAGGAAVVALSGGLAWAAANRRNARVPRGF